MFLESKCLLRRCLGYVFRVQMPSQEVFRYPGFEYKIRRKNMDFELSNSG